MAKKSRFKITPESMLPVIIEDEILDGMMFGGDMTARELAEGDDDWQAMVEEVSQKAAQAILEMYTVKQR